MFHTEETLWWYVGLRHFLRRNLSRYLGHKAGACLLDAGCGTGINLQLLNEFGEAFGIDYSPEAIDFCRQRGLRRTGRASIFHLPFANGQFDAVTCMDVLGHQSITNDVAALSEIRRVLKPGGLVFVHVAALDMLRGPHDEVVMFSKRYSRGELKQAVTGAGLHLERLTFRNTAIFPALLLHRQVGKFTKPVSTEAESDVKLPHPLVNRVMEGVMKTENHIAARLQLPIGSSLFCVARRPGSSKETLSD